MKDMIGDAISCILCVIAAATLAPLSTKLRDDGAPDWLALTFLVIAGVSVCVGAFFAWRLARRA
jgi:hypothetical protein